MLKKLNVLAVGSLLGLGALVISGPIASASSMTPTFAPVQGQTAVAGGSFMDVAYGHRRMRSSWNRHRDGNRCSRRSDRCRYFRNGFYYETPWWTLPLLLGGGIIANSPNW